MNTVSLQINNLKDFKRLEQMVTYRKINLEGNIKFYSGDKEANAQVHEGGDGVQQQHV